MPIRSSTEAIHQPQCDWTFPIMTLLSVNTSYNRWNQSTSRKFNTLTAKFNRLCLQTTSSTDCFPLLLCPLSFVFTVPAVGCFHSFVIFTLRHFNTHSVIRTHCTFLLQQRPYVAPRLSWSDSKSQHSTSPLSPFVPAVCQSGHFRLVGEIR